MSLKLIKATISQEFWKEKKPRRTCFGLRMRVNSHLTIQTTKNLQVQFLDDFFLRLTSLGVVVEPWCGVDFQHGVFSRYRWPTYVSTDHEVNAAQTQAHVAC